MQDGRRILIVGTGGQGVLTTARLLCELFVSKGLHVVSSQLHGMAQRGGSVQASVVVEHGMVPVIGRGGAHIVLGLEPVETVRAVGWMSPRTKVFMNTAPVFPFMLSQRAVMNVENASYPEIKALIHALASVTPHLYTLDAAKLAEEAGSPKTLGVVMLGWLFGAGEIAATPEEFTLHVLKTAPPGILEANTRAFSSGVQAGRSIVSYER